MSDNRNITLKFNSGEERRERGGIGLVTSAGSVDRDRPLFCVLLSPLTEKRAGERASINGTREGEEDGEHLLDKHLSGLSFQFIRANLGSK